MSKRIVLWLPMVFVLVLPACVLTTPPAINLGPELTLIDASTTRRVIGALDTDRFPELEVLRAPASVTINQPFMVTVITYDSSSCTTPAGAAVEVGGLTAIITPVDQKPLKSVPCTANLAPHPREVELTFQQAGQATIQVIGQNIDDEPTTSEYTITVMP